MGLQRALIGQCWEGKSTKKPTSPNPLAYKSASSELEPGKNNCTNGCADLFFFLLIAHVLSLSLSVFFHNGHGDNKSFIRLGHGKFNFCYDAIKFERVENRA